MNGYTALFLVFALVTGGWFAADAMRTGRPLWSRAAAYLRRSRRMHPANVPSAQLASVLRDQRVRQPV